MPKCFQLVTTSRMFTWHLYLFFDWSIYAVLRIYTDSHALSPRCFQRSAEPEKLELEKYIVCDHCPRNWSLNRRRDTSAGAGICVRYNVIAGALIAARTRSSFHGNRKYGRRSTDPLPTYPVFKSGTRYIF